MDSFVIHREYTEFMPREELAKWLVIIQDYGFDEIEPVLESWAEKVIWNKIKKRIDYDKALFEKKISNLKNRKKPSNESTRLDNDSITTRDETDCLNLNVSLNSSLNLNDDMYSANDESNNVDNSTENVEKSDIASHCTTSTVQNIKNTTLLYGFTLTPKQTESFLEKTDSFNGDLPSLVNFIIKKTMAQYEGKPAEELKKLFVNALTKYPESYLDEFHENSKYEKKKAEKDSFMLIYLNPPSRKCTCGTEFEERPDIDEFTNINYTAFKCPSCSTMLTCEKGKWLYSPGASDMAIAAV